MRAISEVIPFWKELTAFEQDIVWQEAKWRNFKKGNLISSAMKGCLGALFVENGQLRAYVMSEEGREVTMYRLHSGDICVFSAACVMNEIVFEIFMQSMENTDVLLLPSKTLAMLTTENVKVALFFSKMMNERFSTVMRTMQQILFFGADKRVAIFLLEEMVKNGNDTMLFTHEEMATIIGSAREVVSRTLKTFEQEGIVKLSRGKVQVIDKEQLKALCR